MSLHTTSVGAGPYLIQYRSHMVTATTAPEHVDLATHCNDLPEHKPKDKCKAKAQYIDVVV